MQTYQDTPYHPFKEGTPKALDDKEFLLVELDTAADTVKVATAVDKPIGVLARKQEGNPHVTVRLLGKGGTVKVMAGGAIPKGSRVIWGTGGKVIVQPSGTGNYLTLGVKLTQGTSADKDIIEILDYPQTIVVGS